MNASFIKATSLSDAWFQLVSALMSGKMPDGTPTPRHMYEIDKGSYVGQKRIEFDYVTVQIDHPGARPLIPDIPAGLGIPAPVESMEYVEQYFARYLMDPELEKNETYKYSTWIAPGVERVIEQLRGAPGNNQAAISVGGWCPDPEPSDDEYGNTTDFHETLDTDNFIDPGTGQRDPACLRVVDFRLDQNNKLHMVVYFRSWDLWGGFPANLAGLQLLKEYVAQQIGAEDGKIIAGSKGLHIYDHCIEVAAARLGMQTAGTLNDLIQFISKGNNQ